MPEPPLAALIRARSYLAALADQAESVDASTGYQQALRQIDLMYGIHTPAIVPVPGYSRALLFDLTTNAIEDLSSHGIDLLSIELLLDVFELAWLADVS